MTVSYPASRTEARDINVVVVEPSMAERDALVWVLNADGYDVHVIDTTSDPLRQIQVVDPDIIVLDIALPGVDGLELCRALRAGTDAYIIIASARSGELDKVVGLAVGADDYLVKPLSHPELVARVGAMLRRPRRVSSPVLGAPPSTFGALSINRLGREVWVNGREVFLTRTEFNLLDVLSAQPDVVFDRATLLELVWGSNWDGDEHLVDVHIANLRKKIDHDGARYIKTVRGVGYRMAVPPGAGPSR